MTHPAYDERRCRHCYSAEFYDHIGRKCIWGPKHFEAFDCPHPYCRYNPFQMWHFVARAPDGHLYHWICAGGMDGKELMLVVDNKHPLLYPKT